jgi:hypothetical protein
MNLSVIARPIPEAAPVTRAIFPVSFPIGEMYRFFDG